METIDTRCAGLDVHKESVVACVRCLDPAGRVSESVRTFATMTADLLDLSDRVAGATGYKVNLERRQNAA